MSAELPTSSGATADFSFNFGAASSTRPSVSKDEPEAKRPTERAPAHALDIATESQPIPSAPADPALAAASAAEAQAEVAETKSSHELAASTDPEPELPLMQLDLVRVRCIVWFLLDRCVLCSAQPTSEAAPIVGQALGSRWSIVDACLARPGTAVRSFVFDYFDRHHVNAGARFRCVADRHGAEHLRAA